MGDQYWNNGKLLGAPAILLGAPSNTRTILVWILLLVGHFPSWFLKHNVDGLVRSPYGYSACGGSIMKRLEFCV